METNKEYTIANTAEKSKENGAIVQNAAQKNPEETETERKKAFEEAEAKRKAEWEAEKAARDEEDLIAWEEATCVSDDVLVKNASKLIEDGTECLTRHNMKICVKDTVMQKCAEDLNFARQVLHPRKNMLNCFHYINRKAREYIEKEMKDNDEKPDKNGMYGADVPDGLCYQWAEEYFNTQDLPEDKRDGEEDFVPSTYRPSYTKPKKSSVETKHASPPAKSQPEEEKQEQLSFL